MDKALKMGQTSAAGGLQVFLGKTLSTIILAVGTIILGMLILESDYGLYAVALIPATTILLFQDWGVGYALTRRCAQCRAENKETDLRRIILAGITFETATGIVLTVVSLLIAPFIATVVFNKPDSTFLISLVSVTILSSAIANAPTNVFVGFEQMKLGSITLICGAAVQSLLGPLLVFLGYGALGAVVGSVTGSVVSATISVCFMYFFIFRKLPPAKVSRHDLWVTLKPLLRYGVPIALGAVFAGLLTQFIAFMMASYCSTAVIGNYKIAYNFSVLLTFFSIPITTVLFPAFSKIDPKKERALLKTVFASATKYTALVIVPATMALIALADALIQTLYAGKWSEAPLFLILLIFGNLFSVLGVIGLQSLLTALAETKLFFITNLISLVNGVVAGFILAPILGMTGLLIAAFIAGLPSLFLTLYVIWKRYEIAINLKDAVRILFASAIAFVVTCGLLNILVLSPVMQLVLGACVFLCTYIVAVPVVGVLNSADIANLRIMFSGIPSISKLLDIPLSLMDRIIMFKVAQMTKAPKQKV
jgi:O-antigen/teichoic acid export membrane protein